MARIDETGAEPGPVVDVEHQRMIGRHCDGDMHVWCGVEIVIGNVDVFAAGPWLWTDEQPRLILVVHAIEVSRRLGDARRALEIIKGAGRRVTVEGTVDITGGREERTRQTLEVGEIHRLVAWAAQNAGYPWWRVDRKLLGPPVAAVSRPPERRSGTPAFRKRGDHDLVGVLGVHRDTNLAIVERVGGLQIRVGVVYDRVHHKDIELHRLPSRRFDGGVQRIEIF